MRHRQGGARSQIGNTTDCAGTTLLRPTHLLNQPPGDRVELGLVFLKVLHSQVLVDFDDRPENRPAEFCSTLDHTAGIIPNDPSHGVQG